MSQNTPSSAFACTCKDFLFNGGDLSWKRMCNKIELAKNVEVYETASKSGMREFTANTYFVTLGNGPIITACKHCLAVLWNIGLVPVLVEYEHHAEIRTLQPKEEVKRITVLERKENETDEGIDGEAEPAF